MNYCGKTDIGRKREGNEDCFRVACLGENAFLFIVCDGMGGVEGGEIASNRAADAFVAEMKEQAAPKMRDGRLSVCDPETEIPMMLDCAIASANFAVWDEAQTNRELHGMGTTLVAALVLRDPLRVFTLNIGDSRAYRIDSEAAHRLTKDHSYVQYLIDKGEITPKEAESRTDKNIITRAVGISVNAQADIAEAAVSEGDMLLLCSDGLYGMLNDDEIHGVATFHGASLEKKTERLVELANNAGGDDNITVLTVEL